MRKDWLGADEFQASKVVVDTVLLIILGERPIHQHPIEGCSIIILVTNAHSGIDQAGHEPIMDATLRMGVYRNSIVVSSQPAHELQGLVRSRPDQVFLMNAI